jgi:hypothetical protein
LGGSANTWLWSSEGQRGNLVIEKIGRRYFVTRANINEMREKCRVVPTAKVPAFGCSLSVATPMVVSRGHAGSSGTVPSSAAQAALQMTLQELKELSRSTSRKSMIRAGMSDCLAMF